MNGFATENWWKLIRSGCRLHSAAVCRLQGTLDVLTGFAFLKLWLIWINLISFPPIRFLPVNRGHTHDCSLGDLYTRGSCIFLYKSLLLSHKLCLYEFRYESDEAGEKKLRMLLKH